MPCRLVLAAFLLPLACATAGPAPSAEEGQDPFAGRAPALEVARGKDAAPAPPKESVEARTYKDEELGFEVERPDGWGFAPRVAAPDGGAIPLVIAQPEKGAQVIVQVAPKVASAEQISGDLRIKLDEHPGIEAGESGPVKAREKAYGFGFTAEGERAGRVAVLEGADRLFVVIGSWPRAADAALKKDVDHIFGSLHGTPATAPAAPKKGGM